MQPWQISNTCKTPLADSDVPINNLFMRHCPYPYRDEDECRKQLIFFIFLPVWHSMFLIQQVWLFPSSGRPELERVERWETPKNRTWYMWCMSPSAEDKLRPCVTYASAERRHVSCRVVSWWAQESISNGGANDNLCHRFGAGSTRSCQIWADLGLSGQTAAACLVRWSQIRNLYPLGCVVRAQLRGRSGMVLVWFENAENQGILGFYEEQLPAWVQIWRFRANVYSRVV